MAQLNAINKIDIELFHPKQYKDGWYYAVVRGKDKFVGLAKKEPFTCDNPDPIKEPGELWFEFGNTPNEAFHAIVSAQQLEKDKVKEYLDSCIVFWRKKLDEEKDSSAVYYVDAFQSMRTSLFGETLPSNHELGGNA
jgi:hypothetical protein